MDPLVTIILLGALFTLLVMMTVMGHVIWLMDAWVLRAMRGTQSQSPEADNSNSRCLNCNYVLISRAAFCPVCGSPRPSSITIELLKDLAASGRQVERFHRSGKIDEKTYTELKAQIDSETVQLRSGGRPAPTSRSQPQFVPSGSLPQPVSAVDTPETTPAT